MNQIVVSTFLAAALAMGALSGCAATNEVNASQSSSVSNAVASVSSSVESGAVAGSASESAAAPGAAGFDKGPGTMSTAGTSSVEASATTQSALDTTNMFTSRDQEQVADTSGATEITLADGQDVEITEEGVYVISGTASNATITVNADDAAKVQLVLNGASITNDDAPAVYVASADKVFVTTAEGTTNTMSVTGTFATSEEANIDGVIFAKDDLVLNGQGTLVVTSSANGIVGKDDVKVTGGTYEITAEGHGIQGKDSVAIADGTFAIKAGTDGIHAKNDDDATLGSVYIAGGTFDIEAGSDGIEGTAIAQIDGGTFTINAAEGIEGTYVQLNDGTVNISATDDGINATTKSTAYDVVLAINGGNVTVNMGSGDTDALDANGSLFINGGTVDITAQSPFDYDGTGQLNGGTVTVNGQQVTELANAMMGGMGGQMGGKMQGGPSGDMSQQDGSMGGRHGRGMQGSQMDGNASASMGAEQQA